MVQQTMDGECPHHLQIIPCTSGVSIIMIFLPFIFTLHLRLQDFEQNETKNDNNNNCLIEKFN